MEKILIRSDRKRGQEMIAVLKRYRIGRADHNGRGCWLTDSELPHLQRAMIQDPSATRVKDIIYVNSYHGGRLVSYENFEQLFRKEDIKDGRV